MSLTRLTRVIWVGASPWQQTAAAACCCGGGGGSEQPCVDGGLAGSVCPLSAADRLSSRAPHSPTPLPPVAWRGQPATLLPLHHLLVARDVSGVQQLVDGRVLREETRCNRLTDSHSRGRNFTSRRHDGRRCSRQQRKRLILSL